MSENTEDPFKGVSPDIAKEIIRLAELQLQAMVAMAAASNQRAATLLGIFSTASIASFGGFIASISGKQELATRATAVLAFVLLFSAATFCAAALWPADFYFPGQPPKSWFNTPGALTDPLPETQLHLAQDLDRRIFHNRKVLLACSHYIKVATLLACAVPPACALTWLCLHFFSGCF